MSHDHHHKEDTGEESSGLDRRSFLKLAGFSFAGAVLAGCQQGKVEKAIPFLIQPEEVTPGMAYWYSTTCGGCNAGCGVLAKNRDGRPIKLEGNPAHPISRAGLCAIGQASILSLYDSYR
ncbi:MAG: Molybdopterin oxidoreductase, partial [Bacteroidetes bacterium]|nr:Molybdopterin oxidoreductase [Bacteroidota bacterium]